MFTFRLLASGGQEIYCSNGQTDLYPLLLSLVTILMVIYECVYMSRCQENPILIEQS